jgi:DNA polymerase-1
MIAIDTENFDPNLGTLGDGAVRDDGFIACIGLYDGKDYVCVKNRNCKGEPDWSDRRIYDWLASDEPKIFHNSVYDLSWLQLWRKSGFKVNGVIHDTMTRAGFIDEYADMGLDDCCKRMHIQGKNFTDTVEKWWDSIKRQWLMQKTSFWRSLDILWDMSVVQQKVEEYNRQDCIATYNLFMAQEPYLADMQDAYQMECDLIPMLIEMKRQGIRIDTEARDRLTKHIRQLYSDGLYRLEHQYGITETILRSPKKMTDAMHNLGIASPLLTATGGESWSADALELIAHPVTGVIQACKNYNSLLTKYLDASLVKSLINGRIHCTFLPTKRDEGGAVTSRMACKQPNLQNIPARESKHEQDSYGDEMRELFLPEEGMMLVATDYKAIEYYLLAHFAHGQQAEYLRNQATDGVDFHRFAMSLTGFPDRTAMKTINYAIIYGAGYRKIYSSNRPIWDRLAAQHDMAGEEYTRQTYNLYLEKLPVVKDTMHHIEGIVQAQGYIESLSGRKHHKPKPWYDPVKQSWNNGIYKMPNALIQGSAADIMKRAMVDIWKSGICGVLKMHLTVHDELVASVPYNSTGTEAVLEMKRLMEAPYKDKLNVPITAEVGLGPNWGYKHSEEIWEKMQKGVFDYV